MSQDFIVTRAEFNDGMQEQVNNIALCMDTINQLKSACEAVEKAHNTLTEVTALHRYVLEKFVPLPLLEQATKEYKALREEMIKAEANAPGHAN